MRPTEIDITSVLAVLVLPLCVIVLGVGVKLIVDPILERRKRARYQKALKEHRIILKKL